jgi:hypothetical protein
VGDVDVDYSAAEVQLGLPGSGSRAFELHGLTAGAPYHVFGGDDRQERVQADRDGVVRFTAPVGPGAVRVKRMD